jgi:FkbM family methyltransferase
MRLHFGDVPSFVWLFEEIIVRQPYAVDLPAAPQIIDCGANIGLSVVYFKQRFPDAIMLAFEPAPDNFDLLQRNVASNHLTDIACYEAALAIEPGTVTLHSEPGVQGSLHATVGHATARPWLSGTRDVEAVRLSGYIDGRVDLLKLDVEGSEGAVLLDLESAGKLQMVDRILIEYHHHLGSNALTLAGVLSLLEANGFDYMIATDLDSAVAAFGFEDVLIYATACALGT